MWKLKWQQPLWNLQGKCKRNIKSSIWDDRANASEAEVTFPQILMLLKKNKKNKNLNHLLRMCSFQLDKKSSLIKSNSKEVLIGILILRIKFKIRKMCLSPILKQPQVVIRFLWFHALTLMPGSVLDNLFGTEQNSVSWMISQYVVKTRGLLLKFHSNFTEMSVTETPPPQQSFSWGFSPCPLQDSQGQTHALFSLQSLLLPGFSASSAFPWDSTILLPSCPCNLTTFPH